MSKKLHLYIPEPHDSYPPKGVEIIQYAKGIAQINLTTAIAIELYKMGENIHANIRSYPDCFVKELLPYSAIKFHQMVQAYRLGVDYGSKESIIFGEVKETDYKALAEILGGLHAQQFLERNDDRLNAIALSIVGSTQNSDVYSSVSLINLEDITNKEMPLTHFFDLQAA